jgi:hypothetical protein
MAISNSFAGMSEKMKGLASRGKAMIKLPTVIFGSPRQMGADASLSWWHVPIFVQPTGLQQKQLDNCVVFLAPYEGEGSPLRMRWRTKDSRNTVTTATLEEERLFFVPIAARKDKGNRATIITNEGFFAEKKAKWTMRPGQTRWTLRVENPDGKWESPHSYLLMVPDPARGNARFMLEVRYHGMN